MWINLAHPKHFGTLEGPDNYAHQQFKLPMPCGEFNGQPKSGLETMKTWKTILEARLLPDEHLQFLLAMLRCVSLLRRLLAQHLLLLLFLLHALLPLPLQPRTLQSLALQSLALQSLALQFFFPQ